MQIESSDDLCSQKGRNCVLIILRAVDAAELPVSDVTVTGASVLRGVTEDSEGSTIEVLAGVEFVTMAVFGDCAKAGEIEQELVTNSFWPREVRFGGRGVFSAVHDGPQ